MPPSDSLDADAPRPVRFCYRCGRRIDSKRQSCWYCGTDTRRTLHPPKKCPFCGGMIPAEAVKCRLCGEFLDGRKTEPASPPPTQVVYVVDRSLLAAAADRRLLPGQPVPPEIARHLSGTTVQAIEHNRPELLDDPRVRALPAPEAQGVGAGTASGPVVDLPPQSTGAGERRLLTGASRDLARRDGTEYLPSRREDTPQRGAGGLERALAAIGRFLIRTAPGRSRPQPEEIEVTPEDRFRICESCQTEILTSDNYCYYCGVQYHKTRGDVIQSRISIDPSNGVLYVFVAILCGCLYWTATKEATVPAWTRPTLAGVGLLMCAAGFFRRRTSVNQVVCIVLALTTVGMWWLI